jgi:hypothetical protein
MSSINASKKVARPASLGAVEPQGVTQYDPANASRKVASPSSLDAVEPQGVTQYDPNKWIPTPAPPPAPSFSPLDLSPTLWVDASDTNTITESGGSVSQWDDKSTNGFDLTQGTGTAQPKTGTRTINGLNVLDFDGFNDDLEAADAADWVFTRDGSTYTIFAVVSADVTGVNMVPFATQTASGSGGGMYYGHVLNVVRNAVNGAVSNAGQAEFTGEYLLTLITDPDNATAADRSLIYIDSGTVQDNNTLTGSPNALNTPFHVASRNGSLYWNGTIAEIIVVNGALTAQQISDAETYLADKWGITL